MAREKGINRSLWLTVGLAGVGGVLGGLVSGWLVFAQAVRPELDRLERTIESWPATGTRPIVTPEPETLTIEVIPFESRPLAPAYPAAFAERRASGVLTLVRRVRTTPGEPVAPEREFGSAVAVTSDGWLVTTDAAFEDVRLADLGVIVSGRVLPIERGIRDASTGVVYLKAAASGLPTAGFVRSADVVAGAPVWVESRPRQLAPEIVLAVRARPSADPISSEVAARRFLVSGATEGHPGSAVWDGAGRLVGLLESEDGGAWRVIPAGPVASGLSQLLATGEIRRPVLGVRALDLAALSFDAATATLPTLGAWLRADRKLGLPAVAPRGPSAGLLQEDDVIERLERDILDGTADLGERLFDFRPGASVNISGRRNGTAFQTQVTLGSDVTSESIR